jgi:hypothetical protein
LLSTNLFIAGLIPGNTCEFYKIPDLLEHFASHKATDTHFSFVDFIVSHFFTKNVKEQRHEKLPEAHIHCAACYFVLPSDCMIEEVKKVQILEKNSFPYLLSYFLELPKVILQPPKTV